MARVTLTDLNKIYPARDRSVHAVKDLNLTVEDGEYVALLGPSGCGKTSTLRMIVGLEGITSGTIAFDGKRVNELTPEQRNVAMAFETYALYPNFTVAENLAFPLEVRGLGKAERDREVARIAKLLRIESILERRSSSPAASQQAGLARAGADPRSGRLHPRRGDEPSGCASQVQDAVRAEAHPPVAGQDDDLCDA